MDKTNETNETELCFECCEEMTKEDIIRYIKDNKKLCNECRFYPDFENWPPKGY